MAVPSATRGERKKMLNYNITIDEIIDTFEEILEEDEFDQDEMDELREQWENPVPSSTNVLAGIRDNAQKKVDDGDERFQRILDLVEG